MFPPWVVWLGPGPEKSPPPCGLGVAPVPPIPAGALGSGPFGGPAREHYLGNPIARASETMAELARLARARVTAMAAE